MKLYCRRKTALLRALVDINVFVYFTLFYFYQKYDCIKRTLLYCTCTSYFGIYAVLSGELIILCVLYKF